MLTLVNCVWGASYAAVLGTRHDPQILDYQCSQHTSCLRHPPASKAEGHTWDDKIIRNGQDLPVQSQLCMGETLPDAVFLVCHHGHADGASSAPLNEEMAV